MTSSSDVISRVCLLFVIEDDDFKLKFLIILVVVNCKHTHFHHTPAPVREVPSRSEAQEKRKKKTERVFHFITGTKERKPLILSNGATTQVLLDNPQTEKSLPGFVTRGLQ